MHKSRMRLVWLVLAVSLLAGGGIFFWDRLTGAVDSAPSGADLALGKKLYDESCAACHGMNLEGEANWRERKPDGLLPAPPHDATGHSWHHPDQQLFAITKLGTAALVGDNYKSAMPGFVDRLSDAEIMAVLGYIKSRWPEDIRRRQGEATERAGKTN